VARLPKWLPAAFAFALGANTLLLTGAVLLSKPAESMKQDITAPTQLVVLSAPQEAPPAEEKALEPEPPRREEAKPDIGPDLFQPDFGGDLAGLGGEGAIAIDLSGGANTDMKQEFVFEAFELDTPARAIVKTAPMYPFKAREQGVEGVVQVKILVREDGTVGEVLIIDARPKDVFEEAVLACVPNWRFEPGVIQGKRVASSLVTALHFKLN
jgi:periplasmic protein TonB